jgi:hypothetical protein
MKLLGVLLVMVLSWCSFWLLGLELSYQELL